MANLREGGLQLGSDPTVTDVLICAVSAKLKDSGFVHSEMGVRRSGGDRWNTWHLSGKTRRKRVWIVVREKVVFANASLGLLGENGWVDIYSGSFQQLTQRNSDAQYELPGRVGRMLGGEERLVTEIEVDLSGVLDWFRRTDSAEELRGLPEDPERRACGHALACGLIAKTLADESAGDPKGSQ